VKGFRIGHSGYNPPENGQKKRQKKKPLTFCFGAQGRQSHLSPNGYNPFPTSPCGMRGGVVVAKRRKSFLSVQLLHFLRYSCSTVMAEDKAVGKKAAAIRAIDDYVKVKGLLVQPSNLYLL